MVGAVLGAYRITDILSAGGMGSVYRAQHELLGRPAAIKLLRPELTANDELVQRFFNEAKAATAIRHPGIVEVYDFGYTEDGHAYLVMELIDGEPLSRMLVARGRLPEIEAASIARSIASALKAAHAKGIIHRDLKPDNIFVVPDPDGREVRVKVLDFGIAKLANRAASEDGQRRTQTGVLMGTPKYMAPEQAREAGTIDHRADLYSIGCILYELLVGQPPFVAEGAGEIIALQLFSEPEPPSKYAPVSGEMERLVLNLLAKEPNERIATANDLMEALVAIGARMSGARDVMQSAEMSAKMSRLDTIPVATSTELPAPDISATLLEAKPKKFPLFLVAGLAVAVIAAVVAFLLLRPHDDPQPVQEAKPQPEVTPSPAPSVEPTPTPSPIAEVSPSPSPSPSASPVVVKAGKGKPTGKTPTEVRTVVIEHPSPSPSPSPVVKGATTEKGSPIETSLDDDKKKNP